MLVPKPTHQGIHVRNFLAIFVCLSLTAYIHFQLNQAMTTLEDTNAIVHSILNNETYSITQGRLYNLEQSLKAKNFHLLSQTECLTKIYLDVLNNQNVLGQSSEKPTTEPLDKSSKIDLTFSELVFPTTVHDLQGFRNCSDILTLMNFLNPTKTDFIYTNFMQEKYGSFVSGEQEGQKDKASQKSTKFCILTNQFNTSTTKLRQNINSVIDQSYQNYKLVVLDNGSTDGSYEIAKVILQDLKEKLTSQSENQAKEIQQKYQIIKEESRLGLWQLYKKHEGLCNDMDYVIFVDGRDSLPTRHTLNILNAKILKAQQRPQLITAALLKRKELNRQNPVSASSIKRLTNIPTFSFKVVSTKLFLNLLSTLPELTKTISHSFELQKSMLETIFEQIGANTNSIMEIDEMLYVYDTIQNKEIDRNEYYLAVVKKQLGKPKKQQKIVAKKTV